MLIPNNEPMNKATLRQILAANVARRMEAAGITTQPALAKKANIAQSHVSRILAGNQSIGLDVIAAVAEAVGCEPWELLTDAEATRQAAMQKLLWGDRVSDARAAETLPRPPKSRRPKKTDGPDHIDH